MTRLLKFAAICLLTSDLFAAATLVQSNSGGSASQSFSAGGTLTTNAVGFGSNTTAGNLLMLCIWVRETGGSTINGVNPNTATVTTSGFTWSHGSSSASFEDNATAKKFGSDAIFYISNASAMSSLTTTTVSVIIPSHDNCTCTLEFSMYEFSGTVSYVSDNIATANNTGTATQPGVNNTLPAGNYLYFVNMTGYPGSNLTAAAGYTLGVNATVSTIGQTAYSLSQSGTTGLQFTGTLGLWDAHAIWFSLASSGASVLRHKGLVF